MARYVRALAALGICTTEPDGVIRLTERGELLRFDQSGSMWATAMMLASPQNRDAWAHFDDALRTGESQFERVHGMSLWDFHRAHPESAAIFDRAMAGVATMRSVVATVNRWRRSCPASRACAASSSTSLTSCRRPGPCLKRRALLIAA
jgi:hypothetical protein